MHIPPMDAIPLQILLRAGSRDAKARKRVTQHLRSAGLEVTASGRATVSARASRETFEQLFGQPAPAGLQRPEIAEGAELPIPPALHDAVLSITVAPSTLLINRSDLEGDAT